MRILVIGQGKMGQLIASTFSKEHEITGLTDKLSDQNIDELLKNSDLVVDFSHPDNCSWIIEEMKEKPLPYVIGTTHLSDQDLALLEKYSESAPVFYDANYSLGIALLKDLAKKAKDVLGDDFDIEIIEKHHNQKQDAPSGTALAILEALNPDQEYEEVFGRKGWTGARKKEIGVHALRGGTLAGFHEVEFLGPDESISLSHNAQNRQIFVNGALKAANFLKGKERGFYRMQDLIDQAGQ